MTFQDNPNLIKWNVLLHSSPSKVYKLITSKEGQTKFWVESSKERDGVLNFIFPNGYEWKGKILEKIPDKKFSLEYISGSITTFNLEPSENGGT
ncbi:MAG: SRPBCC family protein, partial [Candidatus Hodarchaeales archaeon]